MQEKDFPALYQSTDQLSKERQGDFFRALGANLFLLVCAASLSVINFPHWSMAVLQVLTLLGALGCSVFLATQRPEIFWYAGRAVAESIKTLAWRYVSKAEPFDDEDEAAKEMFRRKIKAVFDQNRDMASVLTSHLDSPQISEKMTQLRSQSLEERRAAYFEHRIEDQLAWYKAKATSNASAAKWFFRLLITVNVVAIILALVRIAFSTAPYWPTDVMVAAAASLLSWMQAKRYTELSASYALTAFEIQFVREQSQVEMTEQTFSSFVGDAENAFSREHTQWVARKDN
ncbi:DUF4231 domain-containing protein [Pseudomonas sp. ICMP 460]|uniref:DUF4231 domain-containing protein n=1 Tax=Pseudomonas sp. ICMP 460 TaxID=1718917 RepID=UPI000C06C9C8|nr:DUF4231 domain-containing protein [Pseudomonas sp. ICMP 460]PHN30708.1 anthranilate synthase [Pseudomonas sp. ICMP 460]